MAAPVGTYIREKMLSHPSSNPFTSNPIKNYPPRMLPDYYSLNSTHTMYDHHSINMGNASNYNQNPVFVGGYFLDQGAGSFSTLGIGTSSCEELGMALPRNAVISNVFRSPFEISPNTAYSEGVLQPDRSLFETANNFKFSTESSNVYGYCKPKIDFIDLTVEDIPQLVESNFIDLTVEHDPRVENDLTELTTEDNPIPQTYKQSLDDIQPIPISKNKKHSLDFDDTQPLPKRIRIDYQPGLVDRPMELLQEHVQGPGCNSNYLVPSAESRSQVTSHASNKSDLVQEGTEKRDEEVLKEKGKSTTVIETGVENLVSLIDSFSENQIKEHIASLNQSMSQNIWRRGVQKTEMSGSIGGNTCQLCAIDKNMFKPAPVFCACCDSCIKPHTQFFWALDEMNRKICFCARCCKGSRGNNIAYHGAFISKSQLQKGTNDADTEEPWVLCDDCGRWQHQICALYNSLADTDGKAKYFCPYCLLGRRILGESLPVAFGAKDLPSTPLSDHIEQRLFRQLNKDREDRAKKLGKSVDEVPKAEDLVVRVVLSSQKQLKVSQEFRSLFPHEEYPEEFLYQSKVIMLFQKIEGVDVCLFAMYVQEYGSECAPPNQRSVYISYLDSIKYFKPEIKAATGEALRTYVYQEILIGYLEYCKKQGFVTCYIWVCPPAKCDDYILYCHPESQKIPSTEKLRHWYKAMLKKSIKEGIVMDFTNMFSQFFVQNNWCKKITAARLPYFDGDYWSRAAENIIRDIEKQKGVELERTMMTKRVARSMGYSNITDITDDIMKDILVMQKLGQIFQHSKEDFIVVHLHAACMTCQNVITGHYWSCKECKKFHMCSRCAHDNRDPKERKTHTTLYGETHTLFQVVMNDLPDTGRGEVRLDNDLFGNRHHLLSFCQDNHYQFDTLRRAKHSSMMVLFNLKAQCEFKPPDQQQQTTYQVMLEALVHASRCSATSGCTNLACRRLKKLFYHASTCSKKRVGGCEFCEKSWMLLHEHSRRCKDASCLVPRCKDIRKRMAGIRGLDKGYKNTQEVLVAKLS